MSYLFGIGIAEGERRPIEEAIDAEDGAARAALEMDGFRSYLQSELPLADLAGSAIARTIEAAAVAPDEVDAVFMVTESFWDTEDPRFAERFDVPIRLRHALLTTLVEHGLVNAMPYGNWMSACANFGSTLGLAKAMLSGGEHRNALIIVADKLAPNVPRLMHNGAAIWSDVAAGCMLASEAKGYRLHTAVSVAAPRVATYNFLEKAELPKILLETMRAVKRLDERFAVAAGCPVRDFDLVVANHFHRQSLRILTDVLKIAPERLRREGRVDYAHGYAADNLVTLAKLENDGKLVSGQKVVLFNSSIWAWSLVLIEKH